MCLRHFWILKVLKRFERNFSIEPLKLKYFKWWKINCETGAVIFYKWIWQMLFSSNLIFLNTVPLWVSASKEYFNKITNFCNRNIKNGSLLNTNMGLTLVRDSIRKPDAKTHSYIYAYIYIYLAKLLYIDCKLWVAWFLFIFSWTVDVFKRIIVQWILNNNLHSKHIHHVCIQSIFILNEIQTSKKHLLSMLIWNKLISFQRKTSYAIFFEEGFFKSNKTFLVPIFAWITLGNLRRSSNLLLTISLVPFRAWVFLPCFVNALLH